MAGKKGKVENTDYLLKVLGNSKQATASVAKNFEMAGINGLPGNAEKKKIEYIDIDKMKAAPKDWNRYPLLKETQQERYVELKMSIYERGIENPLVLWEQSDGSYMILAGHNRREICADIIEESREEKNFNEDRYRLLPCIVYLEEELDEEQARDIIGDTNLYRDFSKLPESVKMQIMVDRVELYKRRRYIKGETIQKVMEDFGVGKSVVYDYIALKENVIEPIKELFFSGALKKKSVLRFTTFDKELQQWIYDEFGEEITDARVNALKKNMTKKEIAAVFAAETRGIRKITVSVPESRVEEFHQMFARWLRDEV